ncbi:hypothetical protein Ocin01_13088 [Orchesella cincta]|uniref:Uncharacterized protein n=1 Tax=Orchesella cincta TaxID=48709 RepID=A0A1D2MKQ8_ORCCI|nr:hypothetical protein Ocin01_13088 [Orchesella cincta]
MGTSDVSGVRHLNRADLNRLPRLSADKKTLVVTSEDALPNAFEFLRLNMYLPIQKIVLMKPGVNDTVRVYPIPREGMIGLGTKLSISVSEVGLIILFLVFIIASFAYIFTSISSTKVYWDEEGWLNNDDLCLDATDLIGEDETEDEKVLIRAEKKRKEIEEV